MKPGQGKFKEHANKIGITLRGRDICEEAMNLVRATYGKKTFPRTENRTFGLGCGVIFLWIL